MQSVEQVHRAREIEDFTNLYFVHRISGWLTPLLARRGVRPNTVSLTGMAFGVGAGFAYYHYHNIYWVIVGFALMLGWHVLDGVDGQLARLTNTQSDFGKVIDGICDNVTFVAVYIGLGLALAKEGEAFAWPIILLAGALHSIQAAAYEAQRQEFDFWGYDKRSAELRGPEVPRTAPEDATFLHHIASALAVGYARQQHAVAGIDWELRKQLASALTQRPDREDAIRRRYRETFASTVRRWSALSSNYRTIGIFVFAMLDIPLWYFFAEIFILTPLTFLLIRVRQANDKQLARFLSNLTTVAVAPANDGAACPHSSR